MVSGGILPPAGRFSGKRRLFCKVSVSGGILPPAGYFSGNDVFLFVKSWSPVASCLRVVFLENDVFFFKSWSPVVSCLRRVVFLENDVFRVFLVFLQAKPFFAVGGCHCQCLWLGGFTATAIAA